MSGSNITEQRAEELTGLVRLIVREMVRNPDEVRVACNVGDGDTTLLFTVRTARCDVGKVIGRQGKNADAIRTILEAIGARSGVHVVFHVDDEQGPKPERRGGRDERAA